MMMIIIIIIIKDTTKTGILGTANKVREVLI